jgi:hypothetical protein
MGWAWLGSNAPSFWSFDQKLAHLKADGQLAGQLTEW